MHVRGCSRSFRSHRVETATVGLCPCGLVQVAMDELLELARVQGQRFKNRKRTQGTVRALRKRSIRGAKRLRRPA